jgi:hypothetical protein
MDTAMGAMGIAMGVMGIATEDMDTVMEGTILDMDIVIAMDTLMEMAKDMEPHNVN